jgi:hypothetical protein
LISGKIECALFGDYVSLLQEILAKIGDGLPIIVVQFAKIKIFAGSKYFSDFLLICFLLYNMVFESVCFSLGKISIQNVVGATRIYVNPSIPEVVCLKEM